MIPCILAVDDEKDALVGHQKTMERFGFKVIPISDLDEFKSRVKGNSFDCIHMDIKFDQKVTENFWSEPNGLSALLDILPMNKNIPVMIISNYIHSQKAEKKAREIGIYDQIKRWYPKPADYEIIAFDSIKAINKAKLALNKEELLQFIGKLPKDKVDLLDEACETLPSWKYHINLKSKRIIKKMRDLLIRIKASIKENESKEFIETITIFKVLVLDHLQDYFSNVSHQHVLITDDFISTFSQLNLKNFEKFNVNQLKVLEQVINTLGSDEINHNEAYSLQVLLEENFNVKLGVYLESEKDLNEYIDLIDGEEGYDE